MSTGRVYAPNYQKFFSMCKTFGIFPYNIQDDGTVIDYHRSGMSKLWTSLNMLMLLSYFFYQLVMITLYSIIGHAHKLGWFSQSCWLIMSIFPIPSIMLYNKKPKKVADCLTQWIQLEKDLIGGKDNGTQTDAGKGKPAAIFASSSTPPEPMEYDEFRRGLYCYFNQQRTFKKIMYLYVVVVFTTAGVVCYHNAVTPGHFAYFTALLDKNDPMFSMYLYLSCGIEFYMVALSIMHIGSFEMLMMACVRSVRHCIESLSNLNSVSMERRAVCGRKKPKNDTLDVATIAENIEKRDATQYGSQQEMQVEEATDNYRRVEFVVENINDCFSGTFLAHQTMYLSMMCILIFVFLRSSDTNSFITTIFFSTLSLWFVVRICCLLPFLGKMGEDSEIFIYSWLEEIPKLLRGGKPYETAEVKLHACRILGINCGDYYDIQGSTVLTFFSIVTTYLIILLQL